MNAKKAIQIVVGILVGVGILALLFREVNWSELRAALAGVSMTWLLLSQVPNVLSFFTRIQRWKYIVRATSPASFSAMFSATQIGFLANFTLPFRAGELIRPYVLNRLTGIPFSKGLAMTALDRVTDLIGLVAVMAVGGWAFSPTEDVVLPEELMGIEYTLSADLLKSAALTSTILPLGIIAIFVLLYVNQGLVLRLSDAILGVFSKSLAEFANAMLSGFAEGLHVFRSPSDMVKSILWSLVTWALFLAGTACVLEAFHLDWPWYAPFIIQTTIALLISVAVTPGFIGQFQAGAMAGLMMVVPGILYADALAVGLVAHLAAVIPVGIAGVYCLAKENMGLDELQRASQEAEEELEEQSHHGGESTGGESVGDESTGDESTGGESVGDESTGGESTGGESAGDEDCH